MHGTRRQPNFRDPHRQIGLAQRLLEAVAETGRHHAAAAQNQRNRAVQFGHVLHTGELILERRHQRLDHVFVVRGQRQVNLVGEVPDKMKRLLLDATDARGWLAAQVGDAGIDKVAGLGNAEAENRDRKIRQANIAQPTAATDADTGVIGILQFAVDNGETFGDPRAS